MKTAFLSFIGLFMAVLSFNTASAQNPHFIGDPQITESPDGKLSIYAKVAGLGNKFVTVELKASRTITTECTNPGGNVAPGQTKTETVSVTGTYKTDKNGSVTFYLTTDAPKPGSCPNGKWTGRVTSTIYNWSQLIVDGKIVR